MATQYPKFNRGEYNHVNKSLAVVDYYLAGKTAQDGMQAAKRKHELALDVQAKSTGAMLDKLKTTLKELTTHFEGALIQEPSEILDSAVKRMQGISGTADMQRRAVKDVVLSLIPVFCKLDSTLLDKAGTAITESNKALVSDVQKSCGARGAATGKYNTAVKNWSNVFADASLVTGSTEQEKAECAFNLATRFVDVWRQRARCFLTPVTIEGTSIGTLPPDLREIWTTAYNKLGFNDLKRADIYLPYRHEHASRPTQKEVLNG